MKSLILGTLALSTTLAFGSEDCKSKKTFISLENGVHAADNRLYVDSTISLKGRWEAILGEIESRAIIESEVSGGVAYNQAERQGVGTTNAQGEWNRNHGVVLNNIKMFNMLFETHNPNVNVGFSVLNGNYTPQTQNFDILGVVVEKHFGSGCNIDKKNSLTFYAYPVSTSSTSGMSTSAGFNRLNSHRADLSDTEIADIRTMDQSFFRQSGTIYGHLGSSVKVQANFNLFENNKVSINSESAVRYALSWMENNLVGLDPEALFNQFNGLNLKPAEIINPTPVAVQTPYSHHLNISQKITLELANGWAFYVSGYVNLARASSPFVNVVGNKEITNEKTGKVVGYTGAEYRVPVPQQAINASALNYGINVGVTKTIDGSLIQKIKKKKKQK